MIDKTTANQKVRDWLGDLNDKFEIKEFGYHDLNMVWVASLFSGENLIGFVYVTPMGQVIEELSTKKKVLREA